MLDARATRRLTRTRHKNSGQVAITFALTFALFLFGLLLSVIDLAALYSQQSQIAKAAQDGAVAGSAAVALAHFRTTGQVCLYGAAGCPVVAPATGPATTTCHDAALADYPSGTPTCALKNAYTITATVSRTINLPLRIGSFGSVTVRAAYTAFAQCGTITTGTAGGC